MNYWKLLSKCQGLVGGAIVVNISAWASPIFGSWLFSLSFKSWKIWNWSLILFQRTQWVKSFDALFISLSQKLRCRINCRLKKLTYKYSDRILDSMDNDISNIFKNFSKHFLLALMKMTDHNVFLCSHIVIAFSFPFNRNCTLLKISKMPLEQNDIHIRRIRRSWNGHLRWHHVKADF